MYTREHIVERLKSSVATVTFTKVDGSQRVMTCTLQKKYLPEEYQNREGEMLTEVEGNTVSVWDVNASGWRSFRVSSVTDIK